MHPDLFTIPGTRIVVPAYGAIVMAGFLLATLWTARRAVKVKVDPDIVLNLGFIILIFGMLGARLFYVIHYWDSQFAHQPAQIFNLRAGGMELYGGIIGAFVTCYLYIWLKGYSRRLIGDLVMPALLLAMGIGRIGCFMFGCCWGAPCEHTLPWAVTFPFASAPYQRQWENRQVTMPAQFMLVALTGESGPIPRALLQISLDDLRKKMTDADAAVEKARAEGDTAKLTRAEDRQRQLNEAITPLLEHFEACGLTPAQMKEQVQTGSFRTLPVHPAQLYAAAGPILLALVTSTYFYRRKRHGMVMVMGYGIYAIERFIEEIIRSDNPHDTVGLTVSQAVSVGVFLTAVAWYFILQRMPLRSPRVDASRPKPPKPPKTAKVSATSEGV